MAANSAPLLNEFDHEAALLRPFAMLQLYPARCPEQSLVHCEPMKVSSFKRRWRFFSVTNSWALISLAVLRLVHSGTHAWRDRTQFLTDPIQPVSLL